MMPGYPGSSVDVVQVVRPGQKHAADSDKTGYRIEEADLYLYCGANFPAAWEGPKSRGRAGRTLAGLRWPRCGKIVTIYLAYYMTENHVDVI